jgi:predicted aspartyl protease
MMQFNHKPKLYPLLSYYMQLEKMTNRGTTTRKPVLVKVISLTRLVSILMTSITLSSLVVKAENPQPGGKTPVYGQFMRGAPKAPPTTSPGKSKMYQAKIKRRAGGTPVIDVVFNGSKKFEMIVDTGASGTLITKPMAIDLGVRTIGRTKAKIADGSTVAFDVGRVESIAVNGAMVKNVEVAIAEKMEIGLLGHDFFDKFDVKMKQDVIEFYPR